MNYTPLIIIGAPRSGTNMLRDVLTSFPITATWPCDEINYIWRYGNAKYHSDEFEAGLARREVRKYIRRQFGWVAKNYKAQVVVEKTCANSLRVDFVDKVVPEAKYIFIHRDGLDVVGSAMKRWKAELDIPYLMRKARFVPFLDLPYYSSRYFLNHLHRLGSKEKRLAVWGPKSDGLEELCGKLPLDEICATQWKHCVDSAAESFDRMDTSRWIEVVYENFVHDPENELDKILNFMKLKVSPTIQKRAVANVRVTNVGKNRKAMDNEMIMRLKPLISDTMMRYGYM